MGAQENSHDIKSRFRILKPLLFQKMEGYFGELGLLGGIDCELGRAEGGRGPCLHFNERKSILLFCYDVHLTQLTGIVFFDNPVAILLQESKGDFLAFFAQFLLFSSGPLPLIRVRDSVPLFNGIFNDLRYALWL